MFGHRRKEFSKETKRAAFKRSMRGGDQAICECDRVPSLKRPEGCRVVLRSGLFNYEHIQQDNLGGANDLDNCAVLSRTCWREKSYSIDLPLIAKANRQFDTNIGASSPPLQPLQGGRFDSIKKKMDGSIVDRSTGKVISRSFHRMRN